jgi:di/tricarboxylate transporter
MNIDLIILLLILILLTFMFVREVFAIEVAAFIAVSLLLVFNIISIDDAISGFSNHAVVTIASIFIISRCLVKTGFLEVLSDFFYTKASQNKWFTIFIFLLITSIISGFVNNTAAVAIFIPLAINICQRFHISPTKVLLPLSYASIFGGTLTIIGTSTNLIVVSMMGESPFKMFDFLYLGLIFLAVGTVYNLILVRLLPSRSPIVSLTQKYHLRTFLTEFRVRSNSKLIGKKPIDFKLSKEYNLQILKVIRGEKEFEQNIFTNNLQRLIVHENDIFLVQVNVKNMIKLKDKFNLALLSDIKLNQEELQGDDHVLVEGLITQGSKLIGRTLNQFNFRTRFSAFALAIKRQTELVREKIAHVTLQFSDTILVLVPKEGLDKMRSSNDILILEELDIHIHKNKYWWVSLAVIPIVVLLTSFGLMSITKAVLLGSIFLVSIGVISTQDAYSAIDWSVVFLIAALIPIGVALENTGAHSIIGQIIIDACDFLMLYYNSNNVYISVLYLFTFVLSAFFSNAAVAIILVPIALSISSTVGIDSRPLLVAVCFGASASFMTPMGYQTNMMVYAPGQYRFKDYLYAGFPLTVIFWIIASIGIPVFWPLGS